MQKNNPLRAEDIRFHNQKMVLSKIYETREKGISQSELVSITGLRAPTLFRIFSDFEEQGLIEIFDNSDDYTNVDEPVRKGRRPIVYTTKKDALYTIGVEFWAFCISIGVFDFRGSRVLSREEPLQKYTGIEQTINLIVTLVRDLLYALGISSEKIIGIGVAAPGQVDIKNRVVINYTFIDGVQNYPLADRLEELLGIPVTIHNNCSAMALSEYRYGNYNHHGSMFTFLIRSGVGGAYINRQGIYTSEDKTHEPGHITINYEGPVCYCGLRGCLQAYLTELDAPYSDKEKKLLFSALEGKLANGDEEAKNTMDKAAYYIFVAMKNIIRLYSPRSFLILGNGKYMSRHIADYVGKCLEHEPDAFVHHAPSIFSNTWASFAAQQGASDLVISSYLS